MTPIETAELFHETYERLASQFGYETRKETRKFDPNSPNGRLMIAVCGKVLNKACAAKDAEIALLLQTIVSYSKGSDEYQRIISDQAAQLAAARNWFKDELVRMKMLNELGGPKEESVRQMLATMEEE